MFLGRINSINVHSVQESTPLRASERPERTLLSAERRFTNLSSAKSQSVGQSIGKEASQKRHRPSSIDESQQENGSKRQRTDKADKFSDNANEQPNIDTVQGSIHLIERAESIPYDMNDRKAATLLDQARKHTEVRVSHEASRIQHHDPPSGFGQPRKLRAMTTQTHKDANNKGARGSEGASQVKDSDPSVEQSTYTQMQPGNEDQMPSSDTDIDKLTHIQSNNTKSHLSASFMMERQSVDRRQSRQSSNESSNRFAGVQRNKSQTQEQNQRSFSPYASLRKVKNDRCETSPDVVTEHSLDQHLQQIQKQRKLSGSDQRNDKNEEAEKSSKKSSEKQAINMEATDLLASSVGESGQETSNDYESSLIASSVSSYKASLPPTLPGVSVAGIGKPQAGDVYQKLTYKGQATYLQIEAVWVLDQSKRVSVEVTMDDQVSFLQSKIGEKMEETYDDFRGLRHVVASQVYGTDNAKAAQSESQQSKKGPSSTGRAPHQAAIELLRSAYSKGVSLDPNRPVRDCLKDGETVYFQIETMDLWINTDIHLSLLGRPVLQGKAQFKVSKNSTFAGLRKKLQIFGIKLWCHKNRQPSQDQSEYKVTQLSGNDEYFKEAEKPVAEEYLDGDGGPFVTKDENLATSNATIIEHDGVVIQNTSTGTRSKDERRLSTNEIRFETMKLPNSVAQEEARMPQEHLLYSVDKFELKSQFRTQSPKVDVAIRTSVGVEGVTVTHFVSNQELNNEQVQQLQSSLGLMSHSNGQESIMMEGFNETQRSRKESQQYWDLDGIDEYEQICTLFDYRNQLIMKMDFMPYVQLNTSTNVGHDLPTDIQQLRGFKASDYLVSNKTVKAAFEQFVRKALQKSPFSSSLLGTFHHSSSQPMDEDQKRRADSTEVQEGRVSESMHNNIEILIQNENQLDSRYDSRENLDFMMGSQSEEENKAGFATSVEVKGKRGQQLIQMANIPNISSLHEYNLEYEGEELPLHIKLLNSNKEDEDILFTEVEDTFVEYTTTAGAFGLRDLHNGRIETENKLAVLSDQQYSQSLVKSSKQALNVMKHELLHLKIQFITNVKENYEKVYVWRLHKIYRKLVKDVLDCTYDKQVIARSQIPEVQNNYTAAVTHARRAQVELEQALQVLVEMASGSDKFMSHTKEHAHTTSHLSKETAYFNNKKMAQLAAAGDMDDRPSFRSKSQKQSPVAVSHRLGGQFGGAASARSKMDGLLFARQQADAPVRSRQNSFNVDVFEADAQGDAEATTTFGVQQQKAGQAAELALDLEESKKESQSHMSRHSSMGGYHRGSDLGSGGFSFAAAGSPIQGKRLSTPATKDEGIKPRKSRQTGIIAKMFKHRSSKALEPKQSTHAASPTPGRRPNKASPEFVPKHWVAATEDALKQSLLSKHSNPEEPPMIKTKSANDVMREVNSASIYRNSTIKGQPPTRKNAKSIHLLHERGARGSKELGTSSNEKERPANFQEQIISIFKKRPMRSKQQIQGAAREKNTLSFEGYPRGESTHLAGAQRQGASLFGLGQQSDPKYGGKKLEDTVSPECLIAIIKILAQIQMVHSTFKDKKVKSVAGTAANHAIRKRAVTTSAVGASLPSAATAAKDDRNPASPASHTSQRPASTQTTKRPNARTPGVSVLETESPREAVTLRETIVSQVDELVSKEDFENMKLPQIRKLNFKHIGRNLWQLTEDLQYLNKLKIGLINIDYALDRKPEKQQPSNHNMFRNLFSQQTEQQAYAASNPTKSWQIPTLGQPLNPQQVFNTEQLSVLNTLQSSNLAQAGYLAMINEITKDDQKKLTLKQLEALDQRSKLLGQFKEMKDIPFNHEQFKNKLNMEKTLKSRKIKQRRLKVVVGCIFVLIVIGIIAAVTWLVRQHD